MNKVAATLVLLGLVGACGDGDVPSAQRAANALRADGSLSIVGERDAEPDSGEPEGELDSGESEGELDSGESEAELDAALPEDTGAVELVDPRGRSQLDAAELDAGGDAQPEDAQPEADAANLDAGNEDAATDAASADPSVEQRLVARLRACAALGPGEYNPRRIRDDLDRCLTECLIAAACSELRHFMCSEEAPEIITCQAACLDPPLAQPHDCGDGQIVSLGSVCDGLTQCANSSDELGCPVHTCDDGTMITSPARCDGWPLCPDGSDELGCASICPTAQ